MLLNHAAPADEIMNRVTPSMASPAAGIAAAYHWVRAAAARLVARTKPRRYLVLLQTPHDYSRPFLPLFQQQEARGCYAARFSLLNHPTGRVLRLAAARLLAEYADNPIYACLHSQPSGVECVRHITKVNAVRPEVPRSQHTGREGTAVLPR